MRTTIDLPDDLHDQLRRLAFERRTSLSKIAAELMKSGLERPAESSLDVTTTNGVLTVTFGRGVIRDRDLKAADDEW